jgi:signal transduction histidine kinase
MTVIQCLSIWLFLNERQQAILASTAKDGASRLLNVASELERQPQATRQIIMRSAESQEFRLSIGATPLAEVDGSRRLSDLVAQIAPSLRPLGQRSLSIAVRQPDAPLPFRPDLGEHYGIDPYEIVASAALSDGSWLNARIDLGEEPFQWAREAAISIVLTVMAIVTVVWLLVNKITGPLQNLASASQRLGRGEPAGSLVKAGPAEVVQLTSAFEDMAARMTRLLDERAKTLAAIGHDLRSPITAMRLRTEMVDDDETRERLGNCLDEMQSLVDAALALAKGADTAELAANLNLTAILSDIIRQVTESDGNATLDAAPMVPIRAKPAALRRAFRNLVENAVRYGGAARVTLEQRPSHIVVTVDDDGPGIPDHDKDRVFEPLVRLEASRSRDTGGSGLGLTLSKTVIESHGGRIWLEDAATGGLRVVVSLPVDV